MLLAEVVCVVAEDAVFDAIDAIDEPGDGRRTPRPGVGAVLFPWFLGPTDGSVVDGATGGAAGRLGAGPLVIDAAPEPSGSLFEPPPD